MTIKEYREVNRLSHQAFADMMGVTRVTISNWERGVRQPTMKHISKICAITDGKVDVRGIMYPFAFEASPEALEE